MNPISICVHVCVCVWMWSGEWCFFYRFSSFWRFFPRSCFFCLLRNYILRFTLRCLSEWETISSHTQTSEAWDQPNLRRVHIVCMLYTLIFDHQTRVECIWQRMKKKTDILIRERLFSLSHSLKLVTTVHMRASLFMRSSESFYGLERQTHRYILLLLLFFRWLGCLMTNAFAWNDVWQKVKWPIVSRFMQWLIYLMNASEPQFIAHFFFQSIHIILPR